jgi:hypothetical protein
VAVSLISALTFEIVEFLHPNNGDVDYNDPSKMDNLTNFSREL